MEWWIDHDRHPVASGETTDTPISAAHLKSFLLTDQDGNVLAEKNINVIAMAGDTLHFTWDINFT